MSERGCAGQGEARHDEALHAASDRALLDRTRAGDEAAFGELWRRHRSAAMTAARGTTSRIDPEDLVSEASLLVLETIRRGGGPESDFRPYLFAVVRNLARRQGRAQQEITVETLPELALEDALDDRVGALDRSLVLEAFRSLPTRWREVLWYTEVEGMPASDVGAIVGLRANATAALAYRAREGLRRAWLQAHIRDAVGSAECSWTLEHLGEHARDGLARRAASRMDSHLATCRSCRDVALEVRQLEQCLASVLIVAALGTSGGVWFAAGTGAAATAVATGAAASGAAAGGAAIAATGGTAAGGIAVAALSAVAVVLVTVGVSVPTISTAAPTVDAPTATVLGPDALRIDQGDPAPTTAAGPTGPSGGPSTGGGADDPTDGGTVGAGLAGVVDATTGAVGGTVNGTVEAVGDLASELTGGVVGVSGSVDLGSSTDPGIGLDLGVSTGGLLDVGLDVQLDGSGIGIGLGLGLLGG